MTAAIVTPKTIDVIVTYHRNHRGLSFVRGLIGITRSMRWASGNAGCFGLPLRIRRLHTAPLKHSTTSMAALTARDGPGAGQRGSAAHAGTMGREAPERRVRKSDGKEVPTFGPRVRIPIEAGQGFRREWVPAHSRDWHKCEVRRGPPYRRYRRNSGRDSDIVKLTRLTQNRPRSLIRMTHCPNFRSFNQ
jgi:hypothetical protein